MSTMTYDIARKAATAVVASPKRPGLFARFYARLIAARERSALIELRRHAHLLPGELEQAGWRLTERNEDSLPFIRR